MEIFVARQPIYDRKMKIYGYELLFRNHSASQFAENNGDFATAEVLVNSFLNFDLVELTNNTYSFINFTEKLLLTKIPENIPPSQLIIEILETVEPSNEIIQACKQYRKLGYKLALDDYEFDEKNPETLKLIPFVDIIKVDFRTTSKGIRKKIVKFKDFFDVKLLAEKVETHEEYLEAYQEGFDYFQGYFFQKPVIFSKREIPAFFHSFMLLIEETKKPEPNIEQLAKIIENDLSISYKLLRLINNNYRKNSRIQSIKQAIMLLGLNEFRRWIYILSIRECSKNNDALTDQLVQVSLIRGKFCELLSMEVKKGKSPSSYFLTGMFSVIDSILHAPMVDIVKELPLQEEIVQALLGKDNHHRLVLALILAIEKADWQHIAFLTREIGIGTHTAFTAYFKAIKWTNQILETNEIIQPKS